MSNPLSLPSDNSAAWFFVPAAVATLTTITTRLTAGALGVGAKVGGKVAKVVCMETIGNGLDIAGNKLLNVATKNPKNELIAISFWTTLGMGALGATSLNAPQQSGWGTSQTKLPWEDATKQLAENAMLLAMVPSGIQLTVSMFTSSKKEAQVKEKLLDDSSPKDASDTDKELPESSSSEESKSEQENPLKKEAIQIDRIKGTYFGDQYTDYRLQKFSHGQGTFVTHDQIKYEGEFSHGKFVRGYIIKGNETSYFDVKDAEIAETNFDEISEAEDQNEDVLSTNMQEQVKVRIGNSIDKGKYVGEIIALGFPKEKFAHGKGTFEMSDGTKYEGHFKHGKFITGTVTFPNGSVETI